MTYLTTPVIGPEAGRTLTVQADRCSITLLYSTYPVSFSLLV